MDGSTTFDSLMPRQIAAKAEDAGVSKANLGVPTAFLLAVLAGAFIALGAVFSTVVSTGLAGSVPFGTARLLIGLAFSLGLILVVVAGAELFTGNNLLIIAYASRKVTAGQVLRNWLIVYLGNFVGAIATAAGIFATHLHTSAGGEVGRTVMAIADAKCSLGPIEAFMRGVYCNALVCMAVWLCMSCRTTGDKILAIVFPVTAFVAAGFEHSVANMYFIPAGLLMQALCPPEYWASIGVTQESFVHLSWDQFLTGNLFPVTLGNIVGGAVMVGAVYWVVYARRPST